MKGLNRMYFREVKETYSSTNVFILIQ